MTNWGPATCTLPPGTSPPAPAYCTLFDSGNLPGVVIRQTTGSVSWTAVGGFTDASVAVIVDSYDLDGVRISRDQVVTGRVRDLSSTFTFLNPLVTNRVVVLFAASAYPGQVITGNGSGTYSSDVYCQYGSRMKIGTDAAVYLTPALLSAWLDAASMPWLAPVFVVFWFTTYNVGNLCGKPPPTFPAIGTDVNLLSMESLTAILDAVAWFNLCECAPGSPSPVPYPPPTQPEPPGLPVPPTFSCSNVDVCATLVTIQQQLAALSQTARSSLELVTLLQRYKAPFAYTEGARHPNLTGENEFLIPRLVGLDISVTARSGAEKTHLGNPTYVYDLGWIAIWDANGLLQELRLTRDRMIWLPEKQTEATRFAYALRDGVTIEVTELEAEP